MKNILRVAESSTSIEARDVRSREAKAKKGEGRDADEFFELWTHDDPRSKCYKSLIECGLMGEFEDGCLGVIYHVKDEQWRFCCFAAKNGLAFSPIRMRNRRPKSLNFREITPTIPLSLHRHSHSIPFLRIHHRNIKTTPEPKLNPESQSHRIQKLAA